MSSALAYYYNNTSNTTSPSLASCSVDTPGYLTDNSVGDTSTGYTFTGTSGGGIVSAGLVDLGPSPPSISKWEAAGFTTGTSSGLGFYLYGSNTANGSDWSFLGSVGTSGTITTQSASYRYYLLCLESGGPPGASAKLTDVRLYDASGTLIGPPGSTSAAPQNLTSAYVY
jgi:hypothetical protein